MIQSFSHCLPLEHQYHFKKNSDLKRIYLLLHGYQLDGLFMMQKFAQLLPGTVVAPNGPLPVPILKNGSYIPKYSWYFFDPKIKHYYIGMEAATDYLLKLLTHINTEKWPITIIGYSQGGYLAPKVAEILHEVDTVIGLACIFRSNKFQQRKEVTYDQIHCQNDSIISYTESLAEYNKLTDNPGKYITLQNCDHRISDEYLSQLINLI